MYTLANEILKIDYNGSAIEMQSKKKVERKENRNQTIKDEPFDFIKMCILAFPFSIR